MRPITILAACAAVLTLAAIPVVAHAQSSGTTAQSEAKVIWEKIKGSWTTTKGAVKEQWGKLTDDDLMEIEGRRDHARQREAHVAPHALEEVQWVAGSFMCHVALDRNRDRLL